MIVTSQLPHLHRDKLQRVIRRGDYAVWTNKKYGSGLNVVEINQSTPKKIKVIMLETGEDYTVDPSNVIIITAQVQANIEGNVGANADA